MKIARVEAVPVRLPLAPGGPPRTSFGWPFTGFELLIVRVETDDGLVGYGETPWGFWQPMKWLLDFLIGPVVIGRDAADITGIMSDLQRLMYVLGRYGLSMYALSGLDIALWDIAGKAAGVPLYKLLGGSGGAMPGYATLWAGKGGAESYKLNRKFRWDSKDDEVLAGQTRAALAAGYRHIKLHSTSERAIQIVREVGGPDVRIMIDASCRWTLDEAREAALRLKPYDPYWLEEPIFPPEDFVSLGRLQAETGVPIAAGENACTEFEFKAMFAARAVSFAQPNVTRVGGITEFLKVTALADAHGVEVYPFSALFGPGFLATLQLLAARGRPGLIERMTTPLEATLYGSIMEPVDGHFHAPEGPGLGCDPDPDVMRDYRIQNKHLPYA